MDNAFKTAAYPGYTTKELEAMRSAIYDADRDYEICAADLPAEQLSKYNVMTAELRRRAAVAAGDTSVMTDGERLRFLRTGKAR